MSSRIESRSPLTKKHLSPVLLPAFFSISLLLLSYSCVALAQPTCEDLVCPESETEQPVCEEGQPLSQKCVPPIIDWCNDNPDFYAGCRCETGRIDFEEPDCPNPDCIVQPPPPGGHLGDSCVLSQLVPKVCDAHCEYVCGVGLGCCIKTTEDTAVVERPTSDCTDSGGCYCNADPCVLDDPFEEGGCGHYETNPDCACHFIDMVPPQLMQVSYKKCDAPSACIAARNMPQEDRLMAISAASEYIHVLPFTSAVFLALLSNAVFKFLK